MDFFCDYLQKGVDSLLHSSSGSSRYSVGY